MHKHAQRPARCCPEERAADVLARLRSNPPEQLKREPDAEFAARRSAWQDAIAREEANAG